MGELAVRASDASVRVVERCGEGVSLIIEVSGRDLVSIDGPLLDVALLVIEADSQLSRRYLSSLGPDGGNRAEQAGPTG